MPRGALRGGFVYPALCLLWRAEVSRCFLRRVREKSAFCGATGGQPALTRASSPVCPGFLRSAFSFLIAFVMVGKKFWDGRKISIANDRAIEVLSFLLILNL